MNTKPSISKIYFLAFIQLLFSITTLTAQNSISYGSGSSTYLGELNPYNAPIRSLFGLATRWNVGASYTYQINKKISLSPSISVIRLFGDDNLMRNNRAKELNYLRNLHFRNTLYEGGVLLNYSLLNDNSFFKRPKQYYFFSLGFAYFHHEPEAKAPIIDPTIKNGWVKLRPLMTEGQETPYSNHGFVVPFGAGITKYINKNTSIRFEFLYRLTFTDYLDDVSEVFIDTSNPFTNRSSEIYAAFSKKDRSEWLLNYLQEQGYDTKYANQISKQFRTGIPPFDTEGAIRGNPHVNDSYFTTKFSIIHYFKPPIKCPKLL